VSRKAPTQEQRAYGIGAVAKLTGLSDHTIRVWERRYQAVVARRLANGRRIYSDADVERLSLLKQLTDRGISIGQIAADSTRALRERAVHMQEMSLAPAPARIDVALLGDFLPAQVAGHAADLAPIHFVTLETAAERFEADIERRNVDLLVLEMPIVNDECIDRVASLATRCSADKTIVVYGFSRARDLRQLRERGVVLLRAPINLDELRCAVISAYEVPAAREQGSERARRPDGAGSTETVDAAPSRQFTQQQLANLANVASSVDCECPQHLARLVGDLTAFETYSASCANRNDEDAALHQYLYKTTASARSLIEDALAKVAEAEGLRY